MESPEYEVAGVFLILGTGGLNGGSFFFGIQPAEAVKEVLPGEHEETAVVAVVDHHGTLTFVD